MVKTRMVTVERPLTETELAEKARTICHLLQDIGSLEVEKKAAADQFKGQISDLVAQVAEIRKCVNMGTERVDMECDMLLNTPETGQKSYIDIANGQVVKVEDMLESERQSRLFDADERPDPSEAETAETTEQPGTDPSNMPTDADIASLFGATTEAVPPPHEEELGEDRSHENRPKGGKRRGKKGTGESYAPGDGEGQ